MGKRDDEARETKVTNNIKIEGARLIYKNFQGKPNQFNSDGNRNFGVLIDPELADELMADGWKIKHLKPREDDPEGFEQPWMPVKVKFGKYPPIVVLITSRGKTKLNEETIGQLDWTSMKNVDLIIRPYNYPAMSGRPAGVSAYVKSIYVTANEDDLEMKYANIPDADANDSYDPDEVPFD